MTAGAKLRGFSRGKWVALLVGIALFASGLEHRSWGAALAGIAVLAGTVWRIVAARRVAEELQQPWPWPADFRAAVEAMARPLDPTPKRLLPPDEKTEKIAHVAVTPEDLSRLVADKPPAWPWAVFTSVLVLRRNAVQDRLRNCISGYRPSPGVAPMPAEAYVPQVGLWMTEVRDLLSQTGQFINSPGLTGAFGASGSGAEGSGADPDAILAAGHRLMDYYDKFLGQAEVCVQTPVQPELLMFVQDVSAVMLCPLVGFEQFIVTLCDRIGEAQDLLPYNTGGAIAFDDAVLVMKLPDGLERRINAHIKELRS